MYKISTKNFDPVLSYTQITIFFPAFSAVSGDFWTVPGAKKAITANLTLVLSADDQNTSIKKQYFINVTKMLTGLPKNRDFRYISGSTDRKKIFHDQPATITA